MIQVIENYIATKKLDLNLYDIRQSCQTMQHIISTNFTSDVKGMDPSYKDLVTTSLYTSYNILLYPLTGFWELYHEIKTMFNEAVNPLEPHFIQCWLNVYNKGDYIDWHDHYTPEYNAYHGFFCVDTEPSKTTYRIPGIDTDIDVISEDNLLVMSKSDNDLHRTWPWDQDRQRITIAFDIVPLRTMNTNLLNHWIPI